MKQNPKSRGRVRVLHLISCLLFVWVLFVVVNLATGKFRSTPINSTLVSTVAHQHPSIKKNATRDIQDPFFTLTPRRSRLCYYSAAPSTGIKVIFLDSHDSSANMTMRNIITENLELSLRRFKFQHHLVIISPHSTNQIGVLQRQLRELTASDTDPVLVCNTVNVVIAVSHNNLLHRFRALEKKLVLMTVATSDQDVFCALGEYRQLLRFICDWADWGSSDNTSQQLRYLREITMSSSIQEFLHVDAEFHFFGYIPNNETARDELWVMQQPGGISRPSTDREPRRLISPKTVQEAQIINSPQRLRHRMPQRVIYKPAQYSPSILLFSELDRPAGRSDPIAKTKAIYNALGHASAAELSFSDPFLATPTQIPSRTRKFRLVASLTSLPDRLPHIEQTLQSILNQHVPADTVYLNIPKHYVRFGGTENALDITHIPDNLRKLPVIINLVERDWGPGTKLLPTLQLEPDPSTVIITLDDDMVFKPTLFGLLLRRHLNNPYMAYGNAGQLVDVDGGFGPAVVRTAWQWKDNDYPVDIIEAFRGAIYRRSFFDNMPELMAISPECFFTDDIWISAYLSRRHIPRIKLVEGWGDTAEFAENDKVTPLRNENINGSRRNDVCALSLLQDFKLGWSSQGINEKCSFEFTGLNG
jgi:hypothetical protein